jgi:hypothetical protein
MFACLFVCAEGRNWHIDHQWDHSELTQFTGKDTYWSIYEVHVLMQAETALSPS